MSAPAGAGAAFCASAGPKTALTKIFSLFFKKGLHFSRMCCIMTKHLRSEYIAGWSSSVARRAHNPKVVGSNPAPATNGNINFDLLLSKLMFLFILRQGGNRMIASKLKLGDEVRVIAPARNLTEVRQDVHHHAVNFWKEKGFHLTFSKNSREVGKYHSSSIASRVEDIHEAFCDPNVKMIITCLGGFNSNQLLRHLDYELIRKHPKILCGYSDITALHNAIYSKTGLVTYHGPHYGTFTFDREAEYTQKTFFECVMSEEPIVVTPSETATKYYIIQEGMCEGTIIGGNLCTLNLLQGTPYMPDIRNKVLFLEDDNIMGDYFCYEFDRNLESLLQVEGAETIKGIVFARFEDSCGLNAEAIRDIIQDKVPKDIPVVFGVDFGHVYPMITFPIGGTVRILANHKIAKLVILTH